MYPEFSRLIAGSGHHSTGFIASYDKRFSSPFRMVKLLDRSIKCVHVHMDDFPDGRGVFLISFHEAIPK
jgi:hypothetical protein